MSNSLLLGLSILPLSSLDLLRIPLQCCEHQYLFGPAVFANCRAAYFSPIANPFSILSHCAFLFPRRQHCNQCIAKLLLLKFARLLVNSAYSFLPMLKLKVVFKITFFSYSSLFPDINDIKIHHLAKFTANLEFQSCEFYPLHGCHQDQNQLVSQHWTHTRFDPSSSSSSSSL